jgi:hypothetical protein
MRTAITADQRQTIDIADMFTITKQDSIVIAVTLGIILSVPLWLPALYASTDIGVRGEAVHLSPNGVRAEKFVKSKVVGGNEIITRWRWPDADCRPSI